MKLLFFTLLMIVAPLGSYYLTLKTIWAGEHNLTSSWLDYPSCLCALGNNTYAGATAAVVANIVLIAYVIAAVREDAADAEESKKKS